MAEPTARPFWISARHPFPCHPPVNPESIPLVDLKAQYATMRAEIDRALQGVLDSTAFIMGPEVGRFEAAFADWCGAPYCVGVSSGTAALELTLRALGVGPGDGVITVAHTFIATAEAISAVGATPLFVDIDPVTYTMDPAAFERAITPAVRAVMPVHIYGHPAAMEAINAIAAAHGLAVIEDAAQAHGATLAGDGGTARAGTLAKAGCFSFYPGKNLGAYGDAGAVTTADPALAEQIRLLRNHGRRAKYVHDVIGFGERLDTLQAAVLLAKLPHLDAWTAARRRLAARYSTLLAGLDIVLPESAPGAVFGVASLRHSHGAARRFAGLAPGQRRRGRRPLSAAAAFAARLCRAGLRAGRPAGD